MKTTETNTNRKKEALLQLVTTDDLELFKFEMLTEIQKLIAGISTGKPPKKWLKSEEVKAMLGASTSKLQTLRINGTLPYTRIGGIIYYDAEDIDKMFQSGKFQLK